MNQYCKKDKSRVLFWALLSVLLGLCIMRYSLQVEFPQVILLGLVALMALQGDRDEIIATCICCIPLHTALNYTYALLLCILIYITRYRAITKLNFSFIIFALMVLWELFHCFGQTFSILTFIGDFVPILLLVLFLSTECHELDYDFIVRSLAVSVAAVCILLLLKLLFLTHFNLLAALNSLQRLGQDSEEAKRGLKVVGGEHNPNSLGVMCVLSITGIMQIRLAERKKTIDILLTIFLVVFGALTASRTYLVCIALMFFLLIFAQRGAVSQKLKLVCSIVLVVALSLGLIYLIFPATIELYVERFLARDATSGRLDLMKIYHNFILSDPRHLLGGIGLHNFRSILLNDYRLAKNVPHNSIQELIIAWGLPGLCLFLTLLVAMYVLSKRHGRKPTLLNYIPLSIILFKSMAGQLLRSPYTMMALSYAYLSLCADLTPKDENRILTRTPTFTRESGHNINHSLRKDEKR